MDISHGNKSVFGDGKEEEDEILQQGERKSFGHSQVALQNAGSAWIAHAKLTPITSQ